MSTESASEERAKRRLPRRVLRWLAWSVTALVLLLAGVLAVLETDWARERARRLVEERAAVALGREVSVGSVDFDLVALSAGAREVVVGGPDGLSRPLARAEALSVQVGPGLLGSLSGGPLVLREIVVTRPVIELVFDEQGNSNLPDLGGDGRADGGGAVRIDAVYVSDGTLTLEERSTPLDLSALGVVAAVREAGPGVHLVEASSERLSVELAGSEPLEGALEARARILDGGVTLEAARLEAPRLSIHAAGRLTGTEIDLDLTTSVDAALLAELGWTEAVDGVVVGDLRLQKRAEDLRLGGSLRSPAIGLGAVELIEVRADLDVSSDRLDLRIDDARLAGGRLEGELVAVLGGGSDLPLEVALRLDGVDSTELLDGLGAAPASGIGGLVSGEIAYRFRSGDPLAGSGIARLTLEPAPARAGGGGPAGGGWRLSGDLDVTYDSGRLELDGVLSSSLGRETLLRAEADLPLGGEGAPIDSRFEVSGLDLELLLAAVSDPPPLAGVEGLLSATGSYRFAPEAPLAGSGRGTLRLAPARAVGYSAPRARDGSPVLALSGEAEVSVSGGVLSTSGASLRAPGQEIDLAARIDLVAASGEVDFEVATADLAPLLETMPALRRTPGTETWEPSRGAGSASGRLAFTRGGFSADLALDLGDLLLAGAPIEQGRGRLVIDSGGVQSMELSLEDAGSALRLTGTIPFDEVPGGWEAPDLSLDLEADRWRLADAAPWVPFEVPLAGSATGRLSLGGSFEALTGHLSVRVEQMELGGEELPGTLAGAVDFAPDLVAIGPVRWASSAGEVELGGTYDPVLGRLDLQLETDRLELDTPLFRDRLPGEMSGWLEARASLRGPIERPDLELELAGSDLAIGGAPLGNGGDSRLIASAVDGEVAVRGSLLGLISLDGGGRWDEQGIEVEIGLESSSMAKLAGLVIESPPEITGALAGRATLSSRGEDFAAGLVLDHLEVGRPEGEGGDNRLWNVEPVELRWTDEGLLLESLYLRQEGSDSELFVRGLVGSADTEMDLVMQSSLDAGWLTFMFSDLDVTGRVEVLAAVRGTWSEPRIDGQSRIVDGRVQIENFPHAVERIQGLFFLYPDRIVVDSGEARFARGRVTADGTLVIAGEDLGSYELRLRGTDLDIRYPEEWRLRADAQMTLSSSGRGRLLSGVVEVDRATYARDFELGFSSLLRAMFERRPDLVEETEELLRETRLNISVRGEGALQIQTNIATLSGDLDFTLRGNLARPVMLGDVALDHGGTVEFGGNKYTLERGNLTFSNPFRNDPSLDLVASTTVREFNVRLNVYGPVDSLQTSFSSTPPLPSLDVVSLLTTRSTDTLSSVGNRTALESRGDGNTAETFLASQAASLAGQRVGDLFGLDQVQITPLTGASSELSTARLTVGKRISRDLYVTYSYDPSESGEEIVEVAWQMYPTIVVLLRATDQGSYTADVRWTKSF